MAAVETLSFDRHLRHAFASLSGRLEEGIRSLDGVIEILRLRIEAEAQFASSLEKIISNQRLVSNINASESLRKDGLDAIHADMHNEYTQRIEFLNSLNEDVYQPCVSMRDLYAQKNRSFANTTKSNIKTLRQHQNQFYKIKSKYEKVCKDASNARTALLNAKLDNKISSAQILKLGTKVNSTLKTQQQWREKYDQQQLIWNRQQIKFDDEMTSILQGMQSNEFNRMKTTKDCLNKWAVFITNLCANRNYDVKNLAESMSLINIDNDMQIFIRNVLNQNPPTNPNGITPPHHSFHYGKAHQRALSNLNKTSIEKNSHSKVDTQKNSNSYGNNQNNHNRQRSNNSLSLSSFNPSFNASQRKGSTSYSFSGQQEIIQELSKRPMRQSSSIGSFFKQKFKKDRSMNGHTNTNPTLHLSDLHRENSNTISSYHADSEIYPIDDDEPMTPSTTRRGPNHQFSPTSPKSVKFDEAEIDISGAYGRASSQKEKQKPSKKKKKILNKPKRRRRHIQSQKYRQAKTPKAAQLRKHKPTTPQSPNQILPPPALSKSRSHPTLITAKQNQNTSSYIANIHNRYQHPHNMHVHVTQSPVITPTSVVMTPPSITQTAITINHSAMSPNSKIKMNVQPQQIIVFKTKKSTPVIPPQIPQSSNDIDEDDYDGLSTPTLSDNGDSGHDDDVVINHEQNTPNKMDTPVPVPFHQRKEKKMIRNHVHKSRESANLEFAASNGEKAEAILNQTHFYPESGDEHEPDPLD